MNVRRVALFSILVSAIALSAALPAGAKTVTKTIPATLDFPHGDRPGKPTDCYATIFVRWADVPGTESATVNYRVNGAAASDGGAAPFDDNYPFYSDPPPFGLKVPAGSHWINVGYGSASGYTVPGTNCSEMDQKFKAAFTGPATATITYTETDPNCSIASSVSAAQVGAKICKCLGAVATQASTAARKTVGTKGRDVIVGTSKGDKIDGRGGNDLICSGGGNDKVSGGSGNDKITGGNGNDKLSGGAGKDTLKGDSGNDILSGGAAKDKLFGGKGKDKLGGGTGKDLLSGGPGKDKQKQ